MNIYVHSVSGAPISPLSNAHCAQDKSEFRSITLRLGLDVAGWLAQRHVDRVENCRVSAVVYAYENVCEN